MSVESDLLRQTMRFWATGVTVVTTEHLGVQHGMTVSSFTVLSLTPAQVLISLAQSARTHELVTLSHSFGISILSAKQQDISERFAGRTPEEQDRLAGLETFTMTSGAPLIAGALAHLDCRVATSFTVGTNTIFIGDVLATKSIEDGEPLMYFNRGYRKLA